MNIKGQKKIWIIVYLIILLNGIMFLYLNTRYAIPFGADIGDYALRSSFLLNGTGYPNLINNSIELNFGSKIVTVSDYIGLHFLFNVLNITLNQNFMNIILFYILIISSIFLLSFFILIKSWSNNYKVAIYSMFAIMSMYSYAVLVEGILKNILGLVLVFILINLFRKIERLQNKIFFFLIGISLLLTYGYLLSLVIFVVVFYIINNNLFNEKPLKNDYIFIFLFSEAIIFVSYLLSNHMVSGIGFNSTPLIILFTPVIFGLIYLYANILCKITKNKRLIIHMSIMTLIFFILFLNIDKLLSYISVPIDSTLGNISLLSFPIYFSPILFLFIGLGINFIRKDLNYKKYNEIIFFCIGWSLYFIFTSFVSIRLGYPIERFLFEFSIPISIFIGFGLMELNFLINDINFIKKSILILIFSIVSFFYFVPISNVRNIISGLLTSHNVLEYSKLIEPLFIFYFSVLIIIFVIDFFPSKPTNIKNKNKILSILLVLVFFISLMPQITYIFTRTPYIDYIEMKGILWLTEPRNSNITLFDTRGVGSDSLVMYFTKDFVESQFTPYKIREEIMSSNDTVKTLTFMKEKQVDYVLVHNPFLVGWNIEKFSEFPFDIIYSNGEMKIVPINS